VIPFETGDNFLVTQIYGAEKKNLSIGGSFIRDIPILKDENLFKNLLFLRAN